MIREANVNDIEQIVDINIKTWYTTYNSFIPNYVLKKRFDERDKRIERFKHNISNNINKCFVICDDNIIGYITCGISDDKNYDSEIFSFYIPINYQNKGYGTKLFEYTLKYLKNKGYKNVIVNCFNDNIYKSFYEKQGKLIKTKLDVIGNEEILLDTYYYDLEG